MAALGGSVRRLQRLLWVLGALAVPAARGEIRHIFSLYQDCTSVGTNDEGEGGVPFCRGSSRDFSFIDGAWVCAIEVFQTDHFEVDASLGDYHIPYTSCASHEVCAKMPHFYDDYLTLKVSKCQLDVVTLAVGLFFFVSGMLLFVFAAEGRGGGGPPSPFLLSSFDPSPLFSRSHFSPLSAGTLLPLLVGIVSNRLQSPAV